MLNQDAGMITNNMMANNVTGMSRQNGLSIDQTDHILQSVRDILTTPIGSRVMRRDYGSLLPFLIDSPMNAYFLMQLRAAVIHGLMRWEIRVTPVHIDLMTDNQAAQGIATLIIEYQYTANKKSDRAYLSLGAAL